MFKYIVGLLVVVLLAVASRLATEALRHRVPGMDAPGVILAEFRETVRLGLLEIPLSGVETVEQSNWCGGVEVTVCYHGMLTVGVDLAKAAVTREGGGFVLTLPAPRVLSQALAPEGFRIASIGRWGLWHAVPSSGIERRAVQQTMAVVGERIVQLPLDPAHADRCRRNVEQAAAGLSDRLGAGLRLVWE